MRFEGQANDVRTSGMCFGFRILAESTRSHYEASIGYGGTPGNADVRRMSRPRKHEKLCLCNFSTAPPATEAMMRNAYTGSAN